MNETGPSELHNPEVDQQLARSAGEVLGDERAELPPEAGEQARTAGNKGGRPAPREAEDRTGEQ